jgi:hypothetical protein
MSTAFCILRSIYIEKNDYIIDMNEELNASGVSLADMRSDIDKEGYNQIN